MDPETGGFELPLDSLIDSGKVELKFSTSEALMGSSFLDLEKIESKHYKQFLDRMGMSAHGIEIRQTSDKEENIIFISSKLTSDIDVIHSFKESEIREAREVVRVNDIIFNKRSENKAINVRSLLAGYCDIQYVLSDSGRGSTGTFHRIRLIPALGADKSPSGYEKQQKQLNFDKPYRVAVLLHEIAHSRQHENVYKAIEGSSRVGTRKAQDQAFEQMGTEIKYIRLQERDAVRFSLQTLRQFRDAGFNLVPNLTNDQLVNESEANLLSYDWEHAKNTGKRFSRRVEHLPKNTGFLGTIVNRIKIYREMEAAHKKGE